MRTSTVNRQLVWQFLQRNEPLALARCLRPRPRRHAARAGFEYRAPRLLCQPRQHHQPSRRSACGQGCKPGHHTLRKQGGLQSEGSRIKMAPPSERARPGRGVLSAVFAPAAAPPCDDSALARAPACTAPAPALLVFVSPRPSPTHTIHHTHGRAPARPPPAPPPSTTHPQIFFQVFYRVC